MTVRTRWTHLAFLASIVLVGAAGSFYPEGGTRNSNSQRSNAMNKIVEIRSYTLRPGTGGAFQKLVAEKSIPLLKKWNVDVVAFGPSLHDQDSYFLIRAYNNLRHREQSDSSFYGSTDWREGPREEILSLIKEYTTVVVEVDSVLLQDLRKLNSLTGEEGILHE